MMFEHLRKIDTALLRHGFCMIVITIFLVAGIPLHAQDEEAAEDSEDVESVDVQDPEVPLEERVIDLGELYVEDTLLEAEEILDRPTSFATVLNPRELSRRSIDLPEALDTVPGVSVRTFGGMGALTTISIRGAGSESVLVLLDGVPLNPSGGPVDLTDIPLDSLERIEIIRGGEGAYLGAGAVGGVVRLTSLAPGENGSTSQSARATVGSFGTATAAYTWTPPDGILHVELDSSQGEFCFLNDNGTVFDTSDDFTDIRANNDYTAFEMRAGRSWDLSHGRSFRLSGEWYRGDKGIPGITTFPTAHATQNDRRAFFQANYSEGNISNGSLSIALAWLMQKRSFSDPRGEATGVPLGTSWMHNRWDFRTEWIGSGWSDTDVFTWGANWANESVDSSVYGDENRDTLAMWVRDEWYSPVGAVLVGGLRCDWIDGDSTLSPRGGIKYPLDDDLTARANLGLDFRPPGFEELYRNEGLVVGNPDLVPERTLNFDIGITHTSERVRFEAVYFNLQTRDLIDYLLISGFRWKPYNIGRARSSGLELSADWAVGPEWTLRGNYTRTRAIDTSGDPLHQGRQLVGIPTSEMFGELRWHSSPWEGYLNWEYRGRSPLTPSGTRFLTSYSVAGIGFGHTFNDGISLNLDIKNLFDEQLTDVRGFPLPGRAWFLTVSGEW